MKQALKVIGVMSLMLIMQLGCGDLVSPQPAEASGPELDQIRGMLETVLDRLDSLETRQTEQYAALQASIDALADASSGGGPVFTNKGIQVEGAVCTEYVWEGKARFHSAVTLQGRGDGMAGVDGYGNGAVARIIATGGQMVGVMPQGGAALNAEVCVKLVGEREILTGSPGAAAARAADGPAEALLRGMIESVSADRLVAAASARNMDGHRIGQALDAISTFSLSDLPFGDGAAGHLVGSLPLPPDMADLITDPSRILERAAQAGTFAIDKLCSQTLFTGEFADRASQACDLRDQIPTVSELVTIVNGLDALPDMSAISANVSSLCNQVNQMADQRISIPPRTVNFPLGIGPVETFPGYNAALFPGVGDAC